MKLNQTTVWHIWTFQRITLFINFFSLFNIIYYLFNISLCVYRKLQKDHTFHIFLCFSSAASLLPVLCGSLFSHLYVTVISPVSKSRTVKKATGWKIWTDLRDIVLWSAVTLLTYLLLTLPSCCRPDCVAVWTDCFCRWADDTPIIIKIHFVHLSVHQSL